MPHSTTLKFAFFVLFFVFCFSRGEIKLNSTKKTTQWDKPKISKKGGKTPQYPVVSSTTTTTTTTTATTATNGKVANTSGGGGGTETASQSAAAARAMVARGGSGSLSTSGNKATPATRPGGPGAGDVDGAGAGAGALVVAGSGGGSGGGGGGPDDAGASSRGVLTTPLPPGEAMGCCQSFILDVLSQLQCGRAS